MLELINYNIIQKKFRQGDILYDDSKNPIAVIIGSYHSNGKSPWNIRGKAIWLAVGLASIRGINQSWNRSSSDSTAYDIPSIEKPTLSAKLAKSNSGPDGSGTFVSSQSLEINMDASFSYTQPVKNSKELTDAILAFNPNYMAAKYCRNYSIHDHGNMNLPSMDVLMRIYQSRNIVDSLDPTINNNQTKKLSNWGFGSADAGQIWSSSDLDGTFSYSLSLSGRIYSNWKRNRYGCIPVLEIEE